MASYHHHAWMEDGAATQDMFLLEADVERNPRDPRYAVMTLTLDQAPLDHLVLKLQINPKKADNIERAEEATKPNDPRTRLRKLW